MKTKPKLDSYSHAISRLKLYDNNVLSFGGRSLVKECFTSPFHYSAIFPGIFFKDAVLCLLSRSNAKRIYVYNRYSYLKCKEVLDLFNIKKEIVLCPYLLSEFGTKAELENNDLSVFFEQSIVPYEEIERLDVINKLVKFAKENPEREIVVCLRDYKNSPHKPKATFQYIIEKHCISIPNNMKVVVGRSEYWLPRAKHIISITSSVLLDAIYNNKDISILKIPKSDFYGQAIFEGSGVICADIKFPTNEVDANWKALHINPEYEKEFINTNGNDFFDFKLDVRNISRILKANYIHFGRINKDFIRYSIKNMVFFHRYHKIYLEQQRSNNR
ncbi:DUF6716 putative glycosyltransferase [Vibrio owensii]|uniref:DUF6716 putative glycosyltransferase n=1 Tax=Vibrio owensii TaxID=696485 RepID=UPI003AAC9FAB